MKAVAERTKPELRESEKAALHKIESAAKQQDWIPKLVLPSDEIIQLPIGIFHFMMLGIKYFIKGKSVLLFAEDELLTPNQAANLLDVSRPFLVKLLDKGIIPFIRVGRTHRRIKLRYIEEYQKKLEAEQGRAIDEMARLSQELGMY